MIYGAASDVASRQPHTPLYKACINVQLALFVVHDRNVIGIAKSYLAQILDCGGEAKLIVCTTGSA